MLYSSPEKSFLLLSQKDLLSLTSGSENEKTYVQINI